MKAVARAIETDLLTTLVNTYWFKALFEISRGDAEAVRRDAEIVIKLSRENALALYAGLGALASAWASARLDDRESGATELRQALTAFTDQENKLEVPLWQGLLAEVEAEGNAAGALARIDEALALAAETGEHELSLAREIAETLLCEAERGTRTMECGVGGRIMGYTCLLQGDFIDAQATLVGALRTCDPERDREAGFRFGVDTGATARAYLASTQWLLGEVGPARTLVEEAVAHAIKTVMYLPLLSKPICGRPTSRSFAVMRKPRGATRKLSSSSAKRMRFRFMQLWGQCTPLGQALG